METLLKALLLASQSRRFAAVLAWVERQSRLTLIVYFIIGFFVFASTPFSGLWLLVFMGIFVYRSYLANKHKLAHLNEHGEIAKAVRAALEKSRNTPSTSNTTPQPVPQPPSATATSPTGQSGLGNSSPVVGGRTTKQQDIVWRRPR